MYVLCRDFINIFSQFQQQFPPQQSLQRTQGSYETLADSRASSLASITNNIVYYVNSGRTTHPHTLYETERFPENLLQCLMPLDVPSPGQDWKMLACLLGLNSYVTSIEGMVVRSGKSPTECVIEQWLRVERINADRSKLTRALEQMGRQDIKDNLEDAEQHQREQSLD